MFHNMLRAARRLLVPPKSILMRMAKESRLQAESLGKYTVALLTESWNGRLLVRTSDMVVGKHLGRAGSYDKEIIEYHLAYLTSESKVLVVGAHIGSILVPVARKVASVVGIEANPDTFELLSLNIKLNNLQNVQIYNWAAGDHDGQVDFIMNTHNTGGSKVAMGRFSDIEFSYDEPKKIQVPMRRLDEAIGVLCFDLIIMDVEGAEYIAMQGMPETLRASQRLQIEICPPALAKIALVDPISIGRFLSGFFDKAIDLQEPSRIYNMQEFPSLVTEICLTGFSKDILLYKC